MLPESISVYYEAILERILVWTWQFQRIPTCLWIRKQQLLMKREISSTSPGVTLEEGAQWPEVPKAAVNLGFPDPKWQSKMAEKSTQPPSVPLVFSKCSPQQVDPGPASFHFMLPRYAPPMVSEDVTSERLGMCRGCFLGTWGSWKKTQKTIRSSNMAMENGPFLSWFLS